MYDVIPVTTGHQAACGPASLKMLLAYYGQDVPLDQLIQECGVTVAGTTLARLKQVGEAHGLDTRVYQMDAQDLLTMDRPAIIHWKYTHYVVFCGLDEKSDPVICNSASGRFSLPVSDFGRFFTGYVLCNGEPGDYVPSADTDVEAGQAFTQCTLYRALQPIARGEKLRAGINCEIISITDLMNEQKESEE